MPILPPMVDFGAIFDFWWTPKWTIGAALSRKMLSKSLTSSRAERSGTVLGATCGPKWSEDAPRPEFHGFWIDFQRILVDFVRNFEFIHMCLNHHPTNPETNKHFHFRFALFRVSSLYFGAMWTSKLALSNTKHQQTPSTKYQIPNTRCQKQNTKS